MDDLIEANAWVSVFTVADAARIIPCHLCSAGWRSALIQSSRVNVGLINVQLRCGGNILLIRGAFKL